MTFSASRCLDFSAVYIVTCVILYTLFCIIWSSTTIVLLLPAKYITFVHGPYERDSFELVFCQKKNAPISSGSLLGAKLGRRAWRSNFRSGSLYRWHHITDSSWEYWWQHIIGSSWEYWRHYIKDNIESSLQWRNQTVVVAVSEVLRRKYFTIFSKKLKKFELYSKVKILT
jgi:hypothetical protein